MSKFVAINVFYGDEEYLLNRSKKKAQAWPDREIIELDGRDTSEKELISALSTLTFDGTEVAVVLDHAERVKPTRALTQYLSERYPKDSPSKDTSTVLAAILRVKELPKAWASVASLGRAVAHKQHKVWDEAAIGDRVTSEAKLLNLKLEKDALATLYRVYLNDTGGVVNELKKLSFLVGAGGVVTKEHVLSVCSRQVPVMPWDVSEAAGKKDRKSALTYAGLLFKYEGEGAAVPIVAALMKQVERLLVARSLLDQGKDSKEIAAAINMPPFVYEKNLSAAVKKHSMTGLRTQMKKLCELEVRIKGQAPSKRTLVDLAILSLVE